MHARRWLATAMALVVFAPAARPQLVIGNGVFSVDIANSGVVVGVSRRGVHSLDGARLDLDPGFAGWFGVWFGARGGLVEGAGSGIVPDWAHRPPVELIWSAATSDSATCVTRRAGLLVTTTFTFDRSASYLLVAVTLLNETTEVMHDVCYSSEWRVPGVAGWTEPADLVVPPVPPDVCRRVWMMGALLPGASTGLGFSFGTSFSGPAIDVPLSFWTNAEFPNGLPVGATNGVSFGDYDADGFTDLFACQSGNLWREWPDVAARRQSEWRAAAGHDSLWRVVRRL